MPGAVHNFRALLPLYPRAFESLDLRGFDVVISSTTSFAKGIRVPDQTLHVCYINTPTRFLWYPQEYAREVTPALFRPALAAVRPWLRRWDWAAAQRPHHLIANSHNVQERVAAIYGRTSDVVHCPADVGGFNVAEPPGDYYVVMSRLLPYKRVQLAIEACNLLSAKLFVAGRGPDERRLRSMAGSTIDFVGFVDDVARRRLFGGAKALIVPGIEDFGLVPLEAAAAGRPTVAFAAGGALETIVEGADRFVLSRAERSRFGGGLASVGHGAFRTAAVAPARPEFFTGSVSGEVRSADRGVSSAIVAGDWKVARREGAVGKSPHSHDRQGGSQPLSPKPRIPALDLSKLQLTALSQRPSKVSADALAVPAHAGESFASFWRALPDILAARDLRALVNDIVTAHRAGKVIAIGIGGHVIKTGLAPVIIDLMKLWRYQCRCGQWFYLHSRRRTCPRRQDLGRCGCGVARRLIRYVRRNG